MASLGRKEEVQKWWSHSYGSCPGPVSAGAKEHRASEFCKPALNPKTSDD